MNEIGELNGIFDEEDGCIVANHVVVTFFSIVLDGKATGIAVTIVGSSLAGYS